MKINGKDGTVNGLTNKTWDPNNITSGQAATEDQLKEVDNKITNTSTELTNKGMDFAGNEGEFHRNLGEKVTIKGEGTKAASEYSGENIRTFADTNGNVVVKMDKNLKTETIVATGENGKDGKIGINGKDGQTTNISVTRDGKPGVDGAPGTTTTRIVYEKPDGTKEEVATLNDGMKYGGDTGAVIKKKLNEQVNVVGGITDTNKLTTEDNLGVVSDGNNNLKVRMAKDLKGLNSVTTTTLTVGDVKIANSGYNGVSAVMRLKVKETFAAPYGHDIVMHVWKEGCAVAQALGIGDLWPLMEKEEPNIVANLGNYYPSMAQDAVLHQRQTEISVLNGAIARYGARLGVPIPFDTVITQVIYCIQNNYDKQYLGCGGARQPARCPCPGSRGCVPNCFRAVSGGAGWRRYIR